MSRILYRKLICKEYERLVKVQFEINENFQSTKQILGQPSKGEILCSNLYSQYIILQFQFFSEFLKMLQFSQQK